MLPPPPKNFHHIALHGFALTLPTDWNLRLLDGNEKSGALVFADLRHPTLELRWETPRKFPKYLPPGKSRKDQATTVVLTHQRRLFELHFPQPSPHIDVITQNFLADLDQLASEPTRLWSLYGATGNLPKSARLKKHVFLPGRTTLTFSAPGSQITLGSLALADRLLAPPNTLRSWASGRVSAYRANPRGAWQESETGTSFTAPTRFRLRRARHLLTLTHDREHNRICYRHDVGSFPG